MLVLFVLPSGVFGQVTSNISPKSRQISSAPFFSGRVDTEVFEIPDLDNAYEAAQADQKTFEECPTCRTSSFGKNIPVEINIKRAGQIINVPNGTVYLLHLTSNTATSLMLRFSRFRLPSNATLHLYSHTTDFIMGAFSNANMNSDGRFFTGVFPERHMIVEYYEPNLVEFPGEVFIDGIVHGFRGLYNAGGFSESGTCNLDVNCSTALPDDNLSAEKKGVGFVVRLDKDDGLAYLGTGFLVNSTAPVGSKKPYFLTAHHVLPYEDVQVDDTHHVTDFLVYFNYENSGCGDDAFNPRINRALSFQGCTYKSIGKPSATNGHAEYVLVELDYDPSWFIQVAYLGWDTRTQKPTAPLFNISHPSGDAKKKAKATTAPASMSETASIKFEKNQPAQTVQIWKINWSNGVTEKGSSGSPLLNAQKRVVGILSSGVSRCADTPDDPEDPNDIGTKNGPDFFSKLYLSYNLPVAEWQPLRAFLDVGGEGVLTLDTWVSDPITGGPPKPKPPKEVCFDRSETDQSSLKLSLSDDLERGFGASVSTYNEYFIVGAPDEKRAYIYKKVGCDVIRQATLHGADDLGSFGYVVDMHGDYAIVGDPGNVDTEKPGALYIFKRNGDAWVQHQVLMTPGGRFLAPQFALSAAIWGNHIIVGSPNEYETTGSMYIYKRDATGVWNNVYEDHGFTNIRMGLCVDIKSTRAVVSMGQARQIFVYDLNKLLGSYTVIFGPDDMLPDAKVALSQNELDIIVTVEDRWDPIGPGEAPGFSAITIVNGEWVYVKVEECPDQGYQIPAGKSISNDPNNYFVAGYGWGLAFAYERTPTGWSYLNTHYYDEADLAHGRSYGTASAVSEGGNYILIGDREISTACNYSGSVYVYDLHLETYGDAGNVQVCDLNLSTGLPNVYASNVSFAAIPCSTVYQAGSYARYVVYNDATVQEGFWAKPGSDLLISARPACFGWPSTSGGRKSTHINPVETVASPLPSDEPITETTVEKNDISVYPNPSSGMFRVTSSGAKIISIKFYDQRGCEVSVEKSVVDDNTIDLQCSSQTGLLFLKVTTEKNNSVIKLTIN